MRFHLKFRSPEGDGGGGGTDSGKPVIPDDVKKQIGEEAINAYKASLPKPPDKYELKLPDGTMLPGDVTERTAAIARTLGLTTNEGVQSIIDLLHNEAKTLTGKIIADHSPGGAAFEEQKRVWEEAALKAADIGNGDSAILQAKMSRVNNFLTKYFTEDARKALNEFGLGSHPGIFRSLAKIAEVMREDGWISGPEPRAKQSRADRIYGNKQTT